MINTEKKTRSTPSTGKHLDHEVEIIQGPFGHHAAKLVCVPCQKFIQWLPKNYQNTIDPLNTSKDQ